MSIELSGVDTFSFDNNDRNFKILLCKPNYNRTEVNEIYHILDAPLVENLGGINQLNLVLPLYITNEYGEEIVNPPIENLHISYLIHLIEGNKEDYYVIDKITNIVSEDNKQVIEIICFQQQFELSKKVVRYFEETLPLYDPVGDSGVLNRTLLRKTSWSVGYIDAELFVKARTFSIDEQDLLNFVLDAVKAYGTYIPIFNTVDKTISVYKIENYGTNKGRRIEYGHLLKSLTKDITSSGIVTRLYIEGDEDLSINSVNITGTGFLENLSFYLHGFERDELGNVISHSPHMDDNLAIAWLDYQELLDSEEGAYQDYLEELSSYNEELIELNNDLFDLKTDMNILLHEKDTKTALSEDVEEVNGEIEDLQEQINDLEDEIEELDDSIQDVLQGITTLQNLIKKENNFTSEQLQVLEDNFMHEKTWRDNHYTTAESLLEQGEDYLSIWAYPQHTFEIDIIDVFNALNSPYTDEDVFELGEIVTTYYPEFDINFESKIINKNRNLINHGNASLTIANTNDLNTAFFIEKDYIKNNISVSTSIDMSKHKWDLSEQNHTELNQIINSKWDANKNAIESGTNNNYTLDERGFTMKSPTDSMNYLRAVHNVIGFTNDGGNTYKNALTSTGLVAETVYGILIAGQNLIIQNESGDFVIDEDGVTIRDFDLIITKTDGNSRTVLNATDGFRIQNKVGSDWVDKLYADTNGNLVFTGYLTAGSGNSIFKVDNNGVYAGNASMSNAPFSVTYAGVLKATSAEFSASQFKNGSIEGSTLLIGSGNSVFKADSNGIYLGHSSFSSAPFRVGVNGSATANSLTINNGYLSSPSIYGGTIEIGSIGTNSVWKASSSGMWFGHQTFSSAPFSVNTLGEVKASNINITGGSIDVGSDAKIGNKLFIRSSSVSGGIDFGGGREIYHDPMHNRLYIISWGGVLINNVDIISELNSLKSRVSALE